VPVEWTRRVTVERTRRVAIVQTVSGVRAHDTVTFDVDRNELVDADKSTTNKRNGSGDFVEALARGLDVIKSFGPTSMELTVSEVAAKTGLPRPTARRLLMTLEQLGYTRFSNGAYALTTKTLELGTACIAAQGIWDVARPHMLALVGKTGESSSMSQLDGSDIVYMARVPVAKIIAISVQIGTRFPAPATSMGHVLLADLTAPQLDAALDTPSASAVIPRVVLSRAELDEILADVRERGWAQADELLSVGIRSIAAPVRDRSGRTAAAMNVTVHAAETSREHLVGEYLPLLLEAAAEVSTSWSNLAMLPTT
jgi:IclR family transcriptional regulator, pca regulon regulatory protein